MAKLTTRRIIDIAILIFFIAVVYFVCSKSEKNDKPQKIILQDSMKTSLGRNPGTDAPVEPYDDRRDGENPGRTELKGKGENSISFTLVASGEAKSYTYNALNNLTKAPQPSNFSGYITSFVADMKKVNLNDTSSFSHIFSILLPLDAGTGTFTEKSNSFIIQFFGPENGKIYGLKPGYSFTLTIHEWGGPGGRARGTFFGELKSDEISVPIMFRDGQFDIGIQ